MQGSSINGRWLEGVGVLAGVGVGPGELRRYLWGYFNKVYNGTYNNYTTF